MTSTPSPKAALLHAQAAWMQLQGVTQQYQAAELRGDTAEAEKLRNAAHALLDSNLDLHAEAAHHTRALLGG